MKPFVILVNSFLLLTNVTKNSMLDIVGILEYWNINSMLDIVGILEYWNINSMLETPLIFIHIKVFFTSLS